MHGIPDVDAQGAGEKCHDVSARRVVLGADQHRIRSGSPIVGTGERPLEGDNPGKRGQENADSDPESRLMWATWRACRSPSDHPMEQLRVKHGPTSLHRLNTLQWGIRDSMNRASFPACRPSAGAVPGRRGASLAVMTSPAALFVRVPDG